MSHDDTPHREAIQAVAGLTIGRIERDLGHVDAIFDDMTMEFGELTDALSVLSECAEKVHALMHRLDDGLLRWAKEKHVAAELVESAVD